MTITSKTPRKAATPKVLTAKGIEKIERAEPPEKRREIADAGLPGFYIICQPSGSLSFALRYRMEGRTKKYTIGAYPKFSLEAARKLAREAISAVAKGEDPSEKKKAARRPVAVSKVPQTIDDLIDKFMERRGDYGGKKGPTREGTWRGYHRMLTRDVLPRWKGRRIVDIKPDDVELLLAKIRVDRPVHANRVLAVINKLFNWAMKHGPMKHGLLEKSPAAGVEAPTAETSRNRVLTDTELKLVLRTSAKLASPYRDFINVIILTLQRRCEVSDMQWSEVNLIEGIWVLPAARTKNKVEHKLPLPEAAIAILAQLQRTADGPFVFSVNGRKPISNFGRLKTKLDAAIAEENGGIAVAPWTFHDLRRSGTSAMPRLGVDEAVCEKILNHVGGIFSGVAGVYNRHDYLGKMRNALEAYAGFCARLTSDNVTDLDAHREKRQASA